MKWLVWKEVKDELTQDSVNRINEVINLNKPSSQSERQNEEEREF
jgi:hypothetical protein